MAKPEDDLGTAAFELPEMLDYAACDALAETLGEKRGQPLQIGSAKVRFIGGLAAEILLRAHAEWTSDGVDFEVTDASQDMIGGLDLLGVPLENLTLKRPE